MATLQELFEIEGVIAAGEFNLDGGLQDFETSMDMSEDGQHECPVRRHGVDDVLVGNWVNKVVPHLGL